MKWEGETFVDGTLPFGLRSAPLLFTALVSGSRQGKGPNG